MLHATDWKKVDSDGQLLTYTNETANSIPAHTPLYAGEVPCVTVVEIPPGATGTCTRQGTWQLPKVAAEAIGQGDLLRLDSGEMTKTLPDPGPAGGTLMWGWAQQPAAADETTVIVTPLDPGTYKVASA